VVLVVEVELAALAAFLISPAQLKVVLVVLATVAILKVQGAELAMVDQQH
jgi:hypothetical protein